MDKTGIFSENGKFVKEEYLFYYAIYRVFMSNEKERKEFIDWFYSGNWTFNTLNGGNYDE